MDHIVVVSQDAIDSVFCMEATENGYEGGEFGGMVVDEVAGKDNDVWLGGKGLGDDVMEKCRIVMECTQMDVGQLYDAVSVKTVR